MSQLQLNEQLRAALFQLREVNPRSYVYLLLDGNHPCAEDDALHTTRLPAREIPARPVTVPRADFAHDPAICPALVTLYSPGDRGYPDELLLDLSIAHAWRRHASVNGSYVCGWLVSESPIDQIAAHLAKASELFDVLGGRRRVLALFEPHRLSLAADAGRDGFLRRWLGPVSHWLWLDLHGQLRSLATHDLAEPAPGNEHLGQREWQAQQRVADARIVAMAMADTRHMLPVKPETAIDAALQRATARGLRRTEDLVFCALNDFSIAPGWAAHPAAARAIAQALEGEQTLSELMCGLSDDTLEEIAAQRDAG
ncbi:hypothetical protein [Herbaspirillum robiniae]|uniref:DUF4123 domain-containing protein n=1 Tax=Herbaspirillum robiniae TaxID=2014887 RepID=A0A246WUA3_9BURK|nr:hypothetical protein [Herbaspirillum robiniae]OWY30650.1 hypothetical protein CEJ42_00780 [Herbaspirillum robiniae]